MRLLNIETLELGHFIKDIPQYAILSHTWDDDEILYDDVRLGRSHLLASNKAGLRKILDSCKKAAEDSLKYIWIDTCCIDKQSSAELSEAINSMFEWYRCSTVCYAFLADFHRTEEQAAYKEVSEESFRSCRWLTRGWTLQELLAPLEVRFYDAEWRYCGHRSKSPALGSIDLAPLISNVAGISEEVLTRDAKTDIRDVLKTVTISTRMNWASSRTTTRAEDRAYCLMGLFDVNMPLLYGEGYKSFRRLQEEIAKVSGDQTILAWELDNALGPDLQPVSCYAPDPSAFRKGLLLHLDEAPDTAMSLTGAGLEIDTLLGKCEMVALTCGKDVVHNLFFAGLNCCTDEDPLTFAAILLKRIDSRPNTFVRVKAGSRTVFELGDDEKSHSVDSSTRSLIAGITLVIPGNDMTSITFDTATARRQRILIVEENHQKRTTLPPFRLRYGQGMDGYRLTHALPSAFSTQSMMSEGREINWGLLHLVNANARGFFVVWVIEVEEQSASCEAKSWEEIAGRFPPSDGGYNWMHTVDAIGNARGFAQALTESPSGHSPNLLFKGSHRKVHLGTQLVHARIEFVSFMGRQCWHLTLASEPTPADYMSPVAASLEARNTGGNSGEEAIFRTIQKSYVDNRARRFAMKA